MKTIIFSFLLPTFFLSSLLLVTSCSKEEENNIEKTVVFENPTIDISFDTDGANINIYIDAIDDFTNAIDGTWPDLDLYRIYFDKNNNGILDEGVDFLMSPIDQGICYATLITQTSTSACSFIDGLVGTANFGPTEKVSDDHAYYQLTIPKSLFSNERKVNFTVDVRDSETGWSNYPVIRDPVLFEETFEISW